MTNPNIPPEIADSPAKWKSDDRVCTRWDLCPLAGQLHSHSPTPAPAPVRISPDVRETILTALDEARNSTDTELRVRDVKDAIAFVEALQ